MGNGWGKLILGGLAVTVAWNSIRPERKREIVDFLDQLAVSCQEFHLEKERQQQLMLAPPAEVEHVPTPPSLDPLVAEILAKYFSNQRPDAGPDIIKIEPVL